MTNYYNMAEETIKDKIVMYSITAIIGIVAGPFIVLYFLIKLLVDIYRIGWKLAWAKYHKETLYKRYESIKRVKWKRIDKEQNAWPTDPIERAKCPRLKLRSDNQFECNGYIKGAEWSLIYVANEKCPELEDIFENHLEILSNWAKPLHFEIIYLPTMLKSLQDDVESQKYMIPWENKGINSNFHIGNDYMFRFLIHPEDRERMRHGFYMCQSQVRHDHYVNTYISHYYELLPPSEKDLEEQLDAIKYRLYRESWLGIGLCKTFQEKVGDEPEDYADNLFNQQVLNETTDDLIADIREKVELLRRRGVAQHLLEELIQPSEVISKMVITNEYRIFLPDYKNLEIKMEPLVKAVYLLFLRHPDGLMFKELPDYREELTEIYLQLKPNGLTERVQKSIEDVTDPTKNSINEKCARIRGAFLEQFDNHLAKHYYINGLRAKPKKIALPRELVVWET